MSELESLKNQLQRAVEARKQVESIIEEKTREIYWLNSHLEETVAQRTMELNRQVEFTEKMIGLLNQISTFHIFIERMMQNISKLFDFKFSHFYEYKRDSNKLESSGIFYYLDKERYKYFIDATEQTSFAMGEGLPGTAWQLMKIAYYKDVLKAMNFPRAKVAKGPINVIGAIALPVIYDQELKGIAEFYSDEEMVLNDYQLEQFSYLSRSMGAYYGIYQENRNLKLIFSHSGEGIVGVDLYKKITFINQKACSILGYKNDDLTGQPLQKIVDKGSSLTHLFQSRNIEIHHKDDELFISALDQKIPVEYSLSGIYENKSTVGAVISFSDISDKKRMRRHIATISDIQDKYIHNGYSEKLFDDILQYTIDFTDSRYGFIASIIKSDNTKNADHYVVNNVITRPYLGVVNTKKYKDSLRSSLENIFKKFQKSDQPIVYDYQQGVSVLPAVFQLKSVDNTVFISLPIYGANGLIAIIGLAGNCALSHYSEMMLNELKPLVNTLSSIIESSYHYKLIRNMADKDALTGVYNRNYFKSALDDIIAYHCEHEKIFSLMMIDLNDFKKINDYYGHQVGDEVLIIFSERLQLCLKSSDLLARIGGDEFVVVLKDIDDYLAAGGVAERILKLSNDPYKIEDKIILSGASIGIVSYPFSGSTQKELMTRADFSLYKAKGSDRKWQFYSEELEKQFTEIANLERDFSLAIKENQLFCCYQPQIDIINKRVYGFELLLRWRHPTQGIISPDIFLPIIKKMGVSEEINEYILQICIDGLASFSPDVPLTMSINLALSTSNISSHIHRLVEKIKQHKINRHIKFGFEITESTFIIKKKSIEQQLKEAIELLAENNIDFAIDDFGVEYSSINRLISYRFNTIKIDQVFVQKLDTDESRPAKSAIKIILLLAKDLDSRVIAEGAETAEQVKILRQLGCEIVQGFYFYKPLDVDQAVSLVNQNNGLLADKSC